ncbi:hypothetical protein ACHAPA_007512 [Fusarium lateritium]
MTTSTSDFDLGSALQQLIASHSEEQKIGLEGISATTLLDLITSNAKEIYPSCATRIVTSHETKWDTGNEMFRSCHRARLLRVVPGANSVLLLESRDHITLRNAIDELYRLTAKATIDMDFARLEIV